MRTVRPITAHIIPRDPLHFCLILKGYGCSALDRFDVVSEVDIRKISSSSPKKSCVLRPIPTWLLKQYAKTIWHLCFQLLQMLYCRLLNFQLSSRKPSLPHPQSHPPPPIPPPTTHLQSHTSTHPHPQSPNPSPPPHPPSTPPTHTRLPTRLSRK